MDSDSITQIIMLAILILCSAYFSASETAFFSMNRIRVKNMANDGNKKAIMALKLSEDSNRLISSILIGNNIVNIGASTIATVMFIKLLNDQNLGSTVSTIVMTLAVLTFGEITPKTLAQNHPEVFALFSAPLLRLLVTILTPISFVFDLWQKLILQIFKSGEDRGVTEEELLTMVDEAEQDGGLDTHESELIRNAIEFNDIEVVDIHTNRVDVEAVDISDSFEEIAKVFRETGYSRLPVYEESIDNIIGILNHKDFIALAATKQSIKSVMTKPVFVIPSMKISQLLSLLQKEKSHMAVIIDEYGGTVGIVTLEDILEELVGEIWDEHDEVIENFEKIGENKYRVLCSADLDDLFEKFDIHGDAESSTVSGWVIESFGRIPQVGESFRYENLLVTVTKCDSRHVLEITIDVTAIDSSSEDEK